MWTMPENYVKGIRATVYPTQSLGYTSVRSQVMAARDFRHMVKPRLEFARDRVFARIPGNPHPLDMFPGRLVMDLYRGSPVYGSIYAMMMKPKQRIHLLRAIFRWVVPSMFDSAYLEAAPHLRMSKPLMLHMQQATTHEFVQLLLRAYYASNFVGGMKEWAYIRTVGALLIHGEQDDFIEGVTEFIRDAYEQPEIKNEHRTDTVVQLCKSIRKLEDWSLMPILADALQDAGYEDQYYLNRLRNPASKFAISGGLFRVMGLL